MGYESERSRLAVLAATTAAGQGGGSVVLLGDPGAGKSTLCDDVASRAGPGVVLRACGVEHESSLPFAALHALLGPVHRYLSDLPVPQVEALNAALGLGPAPPSDRLALGSAVLNLLTTIGQPVLAIVDDAQWLDRSSLDVLAFVARRLDDVPLAVVFAQRGERPQTPLRGLPTMHLAGLELDDAAALLRRSTDQVHPGVVERLWGDCGGNPLALREFANVLPPAVLSGIQPLPTVLPAAPRLQEHFGARVAALPQETCAALLIAAAAGGDAGTLEAALTAAELPWTALEAAEAEGVVVMAAGRVAFRHPLVRAAAYHTASPAQQRGVHRLLAGIDPDPDRRAWHLAAATSGTDEQVAARLRETADRALACGGYAEAAAALEAAVAVTADRAARVDGRIDAARAWHLGGSPVVALATLDAAIAEADDSVAHARVHEARGEIQMWLGNPRGARDLLRAEAARIGRLDPAVAARLRLLAVVPSAMIGEFAAARDLGRAAWPALQGGPLAHLSSAALGNVLLLQGDHDAGRALIEPAVHSAAELSPERLDLPFTFLVAQALGLVDRWQESAALADRVIEHGRRHRAPGLLSLPLALLAEAHLRLGRLDEALAEAAEAVEIAAAAGQVTEQGHAQAVLAKVLATLGDEAARGHAEQASELGRRHGIVSLEAFAHFALGLLDLGHQRFADAVRELEHAGGIATRIGVVHPVALPWRPDLVEALIGADRMAEAAAATEDLWVQTTAMGTPWATSAALRCRGLIGGEGAEQALVEALSVLPPERSPFDAGRAQLLLGELLRRGNHRQRARRHLASALGTFTRLGAAPWAARARAELRAAGGRTQPPPHQSLRALGNQELRIALRVASGETNREVAAALYLSPKTVENTLTSVYAKLGVRSRTELAGIVDAVKQTTAEK